jgi:hypothetical protein
MKKILAVVIFSLSLSNSFEQSPTPIVMTEESDPRAYQHGIDFIKQPDGNYLLIWASSGLPPVGEDENGEWTHDVYYSTINTASPLINPVRLISVSGAQEPVSSALSSEGHIMVTMEDAYQAKHTLAQSYAVYDLDMQPIKAYQNIVYDGGHSGHVAAIGNKFAVFYSDEWVEGGGVDDLGSGDDVLLKLYDSNGNFLSQKDVAVGEETRDWWPMIAGGDETALVIWQRFIDDETYSKLMYQVLDVTHNQWLTASIPLVNQLQYYTYDVQYLLALKRFIISGTDADNEGFIILLSTTGEVIAHQKSLPPFVREAQPAISALKNNQLQVVFPIAPSGVIVLTLNSSNIRVNKTLKLNYNWSYSGTDGIFLNETQVYFVSLSARGLQEFQLNLDR